MDWKRRAVLYALVFAGAGALLGCFLQMGDLKFPGRALSGLFQGLIVGFPAGFLTGWLTHIYKDVIRSRTIGGTFVCLILGLIIGALISFWNEEEKRSQNLDSSFNSTALEIVSPVFWGGLTGLAVGSCFGGLDQIIFKMRNAPPGNPGLKED
jgi:fructose-specific phosphotransferase system IIC component